MQSNVWPRLPRRSWGNTSMQKWDRYGNNDVQQHGVHLHQGTDWHTHTHTHTHAHTHSRHNQHNSRIIKSSRRFTLHVTLETKLLCLSIVMLNCLIEMNKHVVHTNTHTHTTWMSNCSDKRGSGADAVREDVLFVGHCGAVSGLLSCSARSDDNNSVFIAEHAGKLRCCLIRPRVVSW